MKRIAAWTGALVAIALAAFLILGPGIAENSMNKVVGTKATVSPRAEALHRSLTIADLHGDTLLWQRDMLEASTRGHIDLLRLQAGNVALQVFSSVSQTPRGQNYQSNPDNDQLWLLVMAQQQPVRTWFSPLERTLFHGQKLDAAVAASNGDIIAIRTRADVARLVAARARGQRTTGALFSVEGLHNLEGDFANLDRLYRAGVRMAGLTHFFDNQIAGSMHGERKGGLTPLGRRVVREMERRGMVIDIAHCSHACVAEVLAMATRPVVSSHGGVQATCRENRNLSDEEIRGVARTGGVIGVGVWDAAVCGTEPADTARAMRHIRDLVGIDHVGLGTDFDGAVTAGYDVSRMALITQALIDQGFTDEEIAKAMGDNVLRVLGQTLPAR
ncbi:peptidase M19 [Sphingomonas lacunae]|uniref:Peptidase M19 n=1 Tax=Sphingomonas lacunae TaxID=2698828 RepID=A0A6M4ARY2_9SPHN|nr:membrane dipeptidase [Sphingomonas lacunae]QJQ31122.1 peptidase M19 [Sphingomonas lacunae]